MEREAYIRQIIEKIDSLKENVPNADDERMAKGTLGSLYVFLFFALIFAFFFLVVIPQAFDSSFSQFTATGKLIAIVAGVLPGIPIYFIIKHKRDPFSKITIANEEKASKTNELKNALAEEGLEIYELILSILNVPPSTEKLLSHSPVKWVISGDEYLHGGVCVAIKGKKHIYYVYRNYKTAISVDDLPIALESVTGVSYKYHPSKIIVGGAAVGGVVTGGAFDAGNFMTSNEYSTDKVRPAMYIESSTVYINTLVFCYI